MVKKTNKIPIIGIISCILYFIVMGVFLITKTDIALTIWEIFIILGAPLTLIVLIDLANLMNISSFSKDIMLVFMACACSLTGLAHIVNITVTRKLISLGVNVPDYFQIGFWPSVESAVDYLAWGFFVGLAFFAIGLAIHNDEKNIVHMKMVVIICGILCFTGFLGTVFISEYLWYLAPMGYGFGLIIICVQMIRIRKKMK